MGIYMTPADHQQVSDAVAAAEAGTAGEIVTVIADQSDGYTDVALAWAAAIAFTAMTTLAFFPDFFLGIYDRLFGHWNADHSPTLIFAIAAAIGITKFIGVILLMLIPAVRMFFVPGTIRTRRVHARAIDLFKVGAERRTRSRTGILIYLSMHEHRAEIVTDREITRLVPAQAWGDAMVALLAGLKQHGPAAGMIAAIEQIGVILAEHLPREEGDLNELPDRLIEL